MKIHQFTPTLVTGDGVSGSVFYTQRMLQELGHDSQVYYSHHCSRELVSGVRRIREFAAADCDLLLVHHSMGHDDAFWISQLTIPKAMIYHNITPPEYFEYGSETRSYAQLGIDLLRTWSNEFDGAIAVSEYNLQDLLALGYSNVTCIPLLVDFQRLRKKARRPASFAQGDRQSFFICVGRIVENKRQHLLIDAYWHLQNITDKSLPELCIVGGTTSPSYENALRNQVRELGLNDHIVFFGKASDANLLWLYQHALALLCASEHEGFCMPLLEAGYFRLPVIAVATSNIPATLGRSGLLLENADTVALAATLHEFLENSALQEKLADTAQENTMRYQHGRIKAQLEHYLTALFTEQQIATVNP
jgi:glycosyltransferase involved in cell wall biosynthesis